MPTRGRSASSLASSSSPDWTRWRLRGRELDPPLAATGTVEPSGEARELEGVTASFSCGVPRVTFLRGLSTPRRRLGEALPVTRGEVLVE